MLLLAVIGMAIPSLLAVVGEGTHPGTAVVRGISLHQLSVGVAIVLLLCYAAFIAYSVFGWRAAAEDQLLLPTPTGKLPSLRPSATVPLKPLEPTLAAPVRATAIAIITTWWRTTFWLPLVVLAVVTALTAMISEVLVGTIEPLTHEIGLNPLFVGLIILPLVGNAAEHFSAITSSARNHMEITMSITAGSSIQIALLVAPILVLAGLIMGMPLDLNFSLFEIAMFGLVTGLYALISLDGESTWLEGLLLLAFYLILAVGTFFPVI
jgi:Ca2+:H+ antiporter